MERVILHSDCNNFYASVECMRRPELREKPVIVVGDKEARHGIVLAKNQLAKSFGIKTGDVVWEAKCKCPDAVEVGADFPEYLRVSRRVRAIYERYTDRVEAFGIDECWLDVTHSGIFGDGPTIAERIRAEIKREIGITVSVGVSFNKIFAKLGSDMKKPDAVTVITKVNYRAKVWPLPVTDLLYVGKATERKLAKYNIRTIGDLAQADEKFLSERLGKWGDYLYSFANGKDETPVLLSWESDPVKSIGNSLTCYRDLKNEAEAEILIYDLAESVAARLRESGCGRARKVSVSVKDNLLGVYGKQCKVFPTCASGTIAEHAMKLLGEVYPWHAPVRALGLSVSDFTGEAYRQLTMDIDRESRRDCAEYAVDKIRGKYGNKSIRRAVELKDKTLAEIDIKGEHVVHPKNYFNNERG